MNNNDADANETLIVTESSIAEESAPGYLNGQGFVRARTERGQWFLLLDEAWKSTGLPVNEEVKAYLVLLLERFIRRTDILDTFVGLKYFMNTLSPERIAPDSMRDFADICLQYAALFPGRSDYRHCPTSVSRSIELAESTYAYLYETEEPKVTDARVDENWWRQAYREMATSLMRAVMVLKAMGPTFIPEQERLAKFYQQAQLIPFDHEVRYRSGAAHTFAMMYLKDSQNIESGGRTLQ